MEIVQGMDTDTGRNIHNVVSVKSIPYGMHGTEDSHYTALPQCTWIGRVTKIGSIPHFAIDDMTPEEG